MSIKQDKSLQLHQFNPLADIEPDDVFYQELDADSSTEDNYTFFIKAPSPNSLLDNEVWIQYSMNLEGQNWIDQFSGDLDRIIPDNIQNQVVVETAVLRDGFCINKSIGNLEVLLNGQQFSTQPYVWQSVLEHLYFSREESENMLSLSGGAFDTGIGQFVGSREANQANMFSLDDHTTPAPVAILPSALGISTGSSHLLGQAINDNRILITRFPWQSIWTNNGWDKRLDKIRYRLRLNSTTDAADFPGSDAFTNVESFPILDIYEKLPIFPFKTFDNKDLKMSLPNVRDMTINVTYLGGTKTSNNIIISSGTDITQMDFSFDISTVKPKIHMKWYNTKMPIPRSVSLPATIIREYEQNFETTAAEWPTTLKKLSIPGKVFDRINLEGIPDLLLIYFAKGGNQRTRSDPNQMHWSIDRLKIGIGSTSHKLNTISQGELYAHYLRNIKHNGTGKMNYEEWKHFHCTAVIRPRDIGTTWGPGFDYPVQLIIESDLSLYWNIPSIQGANFAIPNGAGTDQLWKMYVVAVYDRMSYTINADGTSKLEMLKMPIMGSQQQEEEKEENFQNILGL